jgi:prevent-host-death family protein
VEVALREAKSKLSELVNAAASGERVVITRHGQPVVELVPYRRKGGVDFAELKRIAKELGVDGVKIDFSDDFNDPAYSRRVLGLEDDET